MKMNAPPEGACFAGRGSILIIVVLLAGCTQLQMLPYLDQALILQEFGREKDGQHKFVDNTDAKFDQLLADIKSGAIAKCKAETDIIKTYGSPILTVDAAMDGAVLKRSLYRYAIQRKGPKKVYLYYDKQGSLVKFELV